MYMFKANIMLNTRRAPCSARSHFCARRARRGNSHNATSREIEPVRRSFRRHGSCTFTEVARLVPSGTVHIDIIH